MSTTGRCMRHSHQQQPWELTLCASLSTALPLSQAWHAHTSLSLLCCRFIRDEADDKKDTWEVRLAKRYYSKLFKEYCIADLSRYKVTASTLAQVLLLHASQAMKPQCQGWRPLMCLQE